MDFGVLLMTPVRLCTEAAVEGNGSRTAAIAGLGGTGRDLVKWKEKEVVIHRFDMLSERGR